MANYGPEHTQLLIGHNKDVLTSKSSTTLCKETQLT